MVDVMVRDSQTGYRLARTTSQLEAIQDSVASTTCHDVINQCQPEVLGRYVAHLVEREHVSSAVAARIESLFDSVGGEGNDEESLLKKVCLLLYTNTTYLFILVYDRSMHFSICHQSLLME